MSTLSPHFPMAALTQKCWNMAGLVYSVIGPGRGDLQHADGSGADFASRRSGHASGNSSLSAWARQAKYHFGISLAKSGNCIFFENGAFSQGSIQWGPFSEFGAELGFIAGSRRLRIVQLFAQASHEFKQLTLIREQLKGTDTPEKTAADTQRPHRHLAR